MNRRVTAKRKNQITLRDKLSRLSYRQACLLFGDEKTGAKLLSQGGRYTIAPEKVMLTDDYLQVELEDMQRNIYAVELRLSDDQKGKLMLGCSPQSSEDDFYKAAVLSFVLEEKTLLGLAALPDNSMPLELLDENDLLARAIAERQERAAKERMIIVSSNDAEPWADYTVTNQESGKSYKVALRGMKPNEVYCSCPDFRKNQLGLCKHTLRVMDYVRNKFSSKELSKPYRQTEYAIHAVYGKQMGVRLLVPDASKAADLMRFQAEPLSTPQQLVGLLSAVQRLEKGGHSVRIYTDAEDFIQRILHQQRIQNTVADIRKNPKEHPLRKSLLKVELLPYQMDGIAFAAGAGRAIIADEMGLGKTIQAIGAAELLSQLSGIRKVLVVCPASLKSQWLIEIARFSGRTAQAVLGTTSDRPQQYANDAFFTVCNYEQVLRDYLCIENLAWDLIILDEGQRIKNWEAKTSRVIKSLRSPYALVLSGTPMENRLEELFSVVEFIDDRKLGPAYRFLHTHRMVNESGKVVGYRNLDDLREVLKPILLRRTRSSVLGELPPRTTTIVRIPPTDEQLELHGTHMWTVAKITKKAYISEMDLMRLQKALLMCRMVANSTYLLDKQAPGYSSKLQKLSELLEQLAVEKDRKIVMFSEWTTMLDLIVPLLKKYGLKFVRLDGKVPQKKRQELIHQFREKADCRVFLTTNAGSTGINLQAANTVINVDLPWNPALLEQRIGRAHRMGQKRPVQVYLLITEGTLEENLLSTLSAKNELALAALDPETDVETVALQSGMEELKRRLEVLLGTKEPEPVDESVRTKILQPQQDRVSESCGKLLNAALELCGDLLPAGNLNEQQKALADRMKAQLNQCLQPTEDGGFNLTVKLPNTTALTRLAEALASMAG